MSRASDNRRREESIDAAIERARQQLGFLGLVLAHYTEGLTELQSAERLKVSHDVVWYARRWRLRLPGRHPK